MKMRLDQAVAARGLTASRSEAESWIRLGKVTVDGQTKQKPGIFVSDSSKIELKTEQRYVSRAGLKLASVAGKFGVDFANKTVLDVGSSTGGFTDYALQHGAAKVIAVDVGTDQLHPKLRQDPRVELHEKTDIRSVQCRSIGPGKPHEIIIDPPDIIVIDVSFISLRQILPHLSSCILLPSTVCIAMVKPQFEASRAQLTKDGIVKNDRMRRDILQEFEQWVRQRFVVLDKADSQIAGTHGNRERFYMLQRLS